MNDHILIGRGLLAGIYFLLGIMCWTKANAAFKERAPLRTVIWAASVPAYFCFVLDTLHAPAVLP